MDNQLTAEPASNSATNGRARVVVDDDEEDDHEVLRYEEKRTSNLFC